MNKWIFLFLLVVGVACKDPETVQDPDWLYNRDQMIGFLVDMHIVEAKLIKLGMRKDTTSKIYNFYEQQLFKKHHFVDSIYYKSYNYYLDDVNRMTEIYEAVVDSLNVREQLVKQENQGDNSLERPDQ